MSKTKAYDLEVIMQEWIKQYNGDVELAYLYPHLAPVWMYVKVALRISNTVPQAYPNRERIIGLFQVGDGFKPGHEFQLVDKNRNRTGETLTLEDPEFFEKLDQYVRMVLDDYRKR